MDLLYWQKNLKVGKLLRDFARSYDDPIVLSADSVHPYTEFLQFLGTENRPSYLFHPNEVAIQFYPWIIYEGRLSGLSEEKAVDLTKRLINYLFLHR